MPAEGNTTDVELMATLRLLERTADISSSAATLGEAAAPMLAELCAYLGWPVGHLWMADRPGSLARTTGWYSTDGDGVDGSERFRVLRQVLAAGVGADGGATAQTVMSGSTTWSNELSVAAVEAGLGVSLALPVRHGHEVVAVFELMGEGDHPPAPAHLESVARAALQLGRVVDRQRAAATEDDHRHLLDATRDAFFRVDHDLNVTAWNPRAQIIFGWTPAEALGQPVAELVVPPRFRAALVDTLRRVEQGPGSVAVELTAWRRSDSEFSAELTAWASRHGDSALNGLVVDVGEQRRLESQIARQALHDRLTGLPNRALFRDRLDQALERARRNGSHLAVLLFDLDRFKVVNDSLGSDAGDNLLVAVGARVSGLERPGDTTARLGGDEYALLCENVGGGDEAAAIAQSVLDSLSASFVVAGEEVTVSASVGVALTRGHSAAGLPHADLLLRDAEVAMYRAKHRGPGGFEVFLEGMRTQAADRLSMENDLRYAIRQGQLRIFYQPIVRLETSRVVGFEALVRWEHPTRGLLSPAEFIPPAEATGLIVPLGRLVLAEAALQAAAWQRQRDPAEEPLRMSVNVSARQLSQPGWVDEVADVVADSGLEPRLLVLEITENVLMEDIEASVERLEELRRLGVRIAIDDFGTGYSSLGYLRRLPVDILKIDKSFIDGVAEGPHESALARAVIKLASTLGLDAVAEGIADRRQLSKLQRLHCPYGQGYYFSRPQPVEEAGRLLELPSLPP